MIRRANKQKALLQLAASDWHTVCGVILAAYTDVYSLEKHLAFLSSTWRFVQLLTLTIGESVQGSR